MYKVAKVEGGQVSIIQLKGVRCPIIAAPHLHHLGDQRVTSEATPPGCSGVS